MASYRDRRHFLKIVSLAAASVPALEGVLQAAVSAPAQSTQAAAPAGFQHVTARHIADTLAGLEGAPGNATLATAAEPILTMVLTVEEAKTAAEFEYHEHRDHIFQILDGATLYEVGGKPINPRQIRPGEWLAPASEGFHTIEARKGDTIVIDRMTPHRRITKGKVSFTLISATTPA